MRLYDLKSFYIITDIKEHKENKDRLLSLIDNMEASSVDNVSKTDWNLPRETKRHYKDLFDGFDVERGMYFNGGFQIVNESHKEFFEEVLEFYFKNSVILREKQKAGLSTDQTPINYLVQTKGIEVKLLPQTYNLHHMVSKNLLNFGNSWWGDGMENLYEQAWVYHFNAIPGNPLKRDASYFIKRAYEELYK